MCRKLKPLEKKMKKQEVVRTNNYFGSNTNMQELKNLLNRGYRVVMCNKISNDILEYIVEKEKEEE
jgi:hypothetical protein